MFEKSLNGVKNFKFFPELVIKIPKPMKWTDGNSKLEIWVFLMYKLSYGNVTFKFRLNAIEVK